MAEGKASFERMRDAMPWVGEPEFGRRDPGVAYRDRPGAYALMFDDAGHIAVVETPQGCYLPGGGLEAGESDEDALHREVREECGLDCAIVCPLGVAIEYVHAVAEAAWFRKRGMFFLIRPGDVIDAVTEPDHRLHWLDPGEAVDRLRHGSQKWAVSRWRASVA